MPFCESFLNHIKWQSQYVLHQVPIHYIHLLHTGDVIERDLSVSAMSLTTGVLFVRFYFMEKHLLQ